MNKKRGRGRPKLASKDRKDTVTVSIRLDAALRDRIADYALEQGRTLNKEIADRLENTASKVGGIDEWVFETDQNRNLMRLLGMMIRNFQKIEGNEIWHDPSAHKELKDAVLTVLDAFGPHGGLPVPKARETAGHRRGRSWLTQFYQFRSLVDREPRDRMNEHAVYVDRVADEYIFPEIWSGLGPLANKLKPIKKEQ